MPRQTPPTAPPPESPSSPPTPPPAASNSPRPHSHRFFDWIRSLGLIRQPGWIGGVAQGIADRLGIDVLIVRGIFVVVAVLGGPAILLYALAWLVLPDSKNRIHLEDVVHGRIESPVVAIAILIALSLLPVTQGFWWFGSLYWGQPDWGGSAGRTIWTLVILGLVIWFIVWFARRHTATVPGGMYGSTPAATATGGSGPTPASPATTDDRPDTIPSPMSFAPETASAATGSTIGSTAASTAPTPPPAPAPDASADDLAAWRVTQEKWKSDNEAYRVQQTAERQAAARAAADAARVERLARAAEYRAARARTRSHPLYSVALIGVALIAGAITTLVISAGSPDPIQFLIGAAVAVGILGLGIVINGIIGRRSGGATAIAILLLIPIALAGLFPESSTLKYSGDWTISAAGHQGSEAHYAMGTGNVTLDARDYFSTPRPANGKNWTGSSVNLYVGSGNVTILVPNDEFVDLNAKVLTGSHAENVYRSYKLGTDQQPVNETRELYIEVVVGTGRITIERAPVSTGVPAS